MTITKEKWIHSYREETSGPIGKKVGRGAR